MLCSPSSRAEREFLEQDPNVHGWVLDEVESVERESLQIVAVQSKLLQLQEEDNSGLDLITLVVRYRDYLRSLELDAWLQHIFEPDPTMLPSYLLR